MARRFAAQSTAEAAVVFAALGDATRLELMRCLCADGPSSITRLCAVADMSRQAITKHLDVLAGAGLVDSERVGRERIWTLAPQGVQGAQRYLQATAKQWDTALDRLRQFVED